MSKVFKTQTYYEFGYRAPNGGEYFSYRHNDGWYISYNAEYGIPAIDVWGGGQEGGLIRDILDARGYDDWPVLMKRVDMIYYEAEEVA